MADVDVNAWLADVSTALGVDLRDALPDEMRSEMLDLTGEIAHRVVRVAVPWTSYLMGVAVGRGATPQQALRIVHEALPQVSTGEE